MEYDIWGNDRGGFIARVATQEIAENSPDGYHKHLWRVQAANGIQARHLYIKERDKKPT